VEIRLICLPGALRLVSMIEKDCWRWATLRPPRTIIACKTFLVWKAIAQLLIIIQPPNDRTSLLPVIRFRDSLTLTASYYRRIMPAICASSCPQKIAEVKLRQFGGVA